MSGKLLKTKKMKISAKKTDDVTDEQLIVLVGTYKEKQLDWIKENGYYNYPVKDGDEYDEEKFENIKELWLYADVKGTRHCYIAEYAGILTREEFLEQHPTYAKLGKPRHKKYYIFRAMPIVYDRLLSNPIVVARASDFGGRSAKVKKAIEQFKADGEFAPLAAYLPADLAKVPRQQLRVCEAAVQMNFFGALIVPPAMQELEPVDNDKYNVISMFSGAMGLDNGIEKAGMNIRLCVEIQHAMAETIRANKPDTPLIEDDIRNYSGKDLLHAAGIKAGEEVFLVCGGPPCQAFSTAGKRLGFDDDRGNVFLKYIGLIGEIRPKYFLLENVRGLLSATYEAPGMRLKPGAKGSALLYALDKIKSLGYSATFTLYDSANYGVPQKRERVIILGSRDGYKIPLIPPTHSLNGSLILKKWVTFRSAVAGLKRCTAAPIPAKRLKYFRMLGPGQCWKDLPKAVQRVAMGKSFDLQGGKTGFYRRLAWDEPSPTLVTCPTMPATDLMHPTEDRALSIEEYARIQMFPDHWIFKGSMADVYKQIGNAVPVGMGFAAAKHILWFDALSEAEKAHVQLIDKSATYSRYRNTSFEYFEELLTKLQQLEEC